ncbi:uncharacterized protein LOC108096998 [Drosophila ficusphila]|uniref:uncharacterized protein LOC108096998 n=1 Tax=Drosophila ficusphila TaxID=30025 RepID=UPI0007E6BABE|nr:uncharacterized protein LOC108096998 [Drosophila ficusphila]
MFKVNQLHVLILVGCFALIRAQRQHQQQAGIHLHPAWLYSMPWRPLILPTAKPLSTLAGISQISQGYTGPQTFPQNQQQDQLEQQLQQQYIMQQPYQQSTTQGQYPQQSVLVGLFTPQLQAYPLATPPQAGHFSLPFRPSQFVGYTDDEDGGNEQGIRSPDHQPQHQLAEPPFLVDSYNKPVAEKSEQPSDSKGFGGGGGPLGYVYLSPSNSYNIVQS